MRQLENAGLYGNGLVPIETPRLVSRYNECLQAMGIAPTSLRAFRVDGVGWSPEIAEEKEDLTYLSHGVENPLAIILTPDQQGKPVYISYYSFQRELMNQYFRQNAPEIADLTTETGIWLDMDQGLSAYRKPADLLLIGDIVVRSSTFSDLQEACREQRRLASRFLEPGEAWFDQSLRTAILESARRYGDLRNRRLAIAPMSFSNTEVFYTKAFEGVYVFRGLASCKNLMVFEDERQVPAQLDTSSRACSVSNFRWLKQLLEEKVLEIDLERYAKHPEDLIRIQDCLLVDTFATQDPGIDFLRLTSGQKKGLINRFRGSIPELYFEIEVLLRRFESGEIPDSNKLSLETKAVVCHPQQKAPPLLRKVLWQLLGRSHPVDVWRLYRHNKELFYRMYQTFPETKKAWAVHTISQHISRGVED